MASREEMSTSFGAAAGVYESGRPEYPREAVEWLLEPLRAEQRAIRVADVGAGTGKLTRTLVEAGAEVVAIDPDPDMLTTLRGNVRAVPTFAGTGERMPLPDASVDAVAFGQAWHWVDPVAASAEAARVLRPGGVLGLIWNVRDERVEWVRRLTAIMHGSAAETMIAEGGPAPRHPFDSFDRRTWDWKRPLTKHAFLDMAASRSYILTAPEDERTRILHEVGELYDEVGGDGEVALPYRTEAFRGIRP
ncbi:methyltransferase domain-containing protein [Microbacterium sp. BK668]|uniref:class I SAM-dependent methyltransferase n=1 Tax=Microbacterium sp. BK668 TaxID=2512118 RepID=UPI00105DC5D2|nr:methyltransferase domain-containing protein [Microbacterium sp. BK668]TDN92433.1 methyltransferase family protein [Microbacterium sp. BK668]